MNFHLEYLKFTNLKVSINFFVKIIIIKYIQNLKPLLFYKYNYY